MQTHPHIWFQRLCLVAAGLLGASGVAAAAAASHTGDSRIFGAVATIALPHAAALVAFSLVPRPGMLMRAGAILIAAGSVLFCLDLAARHYLGSALFPMSAPFGGTAIIAGWLVIAAAGIAVRRNPQLPDDS